jgi:hypothetical protein
LGDVACSTAADHGHALIWTRYSPTILQVIHDVKEVAAWRLHARRANAGPVWQHQLGDRFVRHEKEWGARLEHMRFNPVRKGLVGKPEDGRWSGYKNFALDPRTVARCPIKIDYVRLPAGYQA